MIIRIVAVGKLKERYWQESFSEYAKRLRPYARLEVIEVPEQPLPSRYQPAEEARTMAVEAEAILDRLARYDYGSLVVLDRRGKELDSTDLAGWLDDQILKGVGGINWVIGGPLGLSPQLTEKADLVLSLSRMTFTHEMARVFLLEQIYRSFRIIRHEPYHR